MPDKIVMFLQARRRSDLFDREFCQQKEQEIHYKEKKEDHLK